ncbi:hydroxymethylpyrimidine/phosphomethylpyrimidine kinase [Pedobacter sp. UYP30]|uniref:bifunctional hydroxymethylpyrimidine kinase/phosphomethylpyrimidine kinase n=1 Tax=Pedobacter sp. UYP30 TaxID=1756400 RepID=UPI003394315C
MQPFNYAPVLSIAGSDSGAGAGIQADLKTFAALGCYGISAITAITAQNTLGIYAIHPVPAEIVKQQIIAVMDDFKPKAIKIGMLFSAEIVVAVAETLKNHPNIPVIFDPVISASSGDTLIQENVLKAFKEHLFPLVTLLTPNLFEASQLSNQHVKTVEDMEKAAKLLINEDLKSVLIKGGHLESERLINFYLDKNGISKQFKSTKIESKNLHGTGCTLSSAITAFLAQGFDLLTAIKKSGEFVNKAIEASVNLKIGNGAGPLNHFFDFHRNHS